jgi:quercetin dioxygenase-like cupin family protein
MSESTDRTLEPLDAVHRHPAELVEETVRAIEGVVQQGHLSVEVLMVTEAMVMMKVRREKGLIDPSHVHEDHESVATLISGRMRNYIGDEEFISEAGSVWRHPPGVVHSSEALEDCVQIEVKTPARKTWA